MIWQMLDWLAKPDRYVARRDKDGMFHVKHIDELGPGDRVIDLSAARAPDGTAQGLLADDGAALLSQSRSAESSKQDSENDIPHWWLLSTH